ncbi:MAG TPA: hypothetical protein PK864_07435 [Syntrophorhabdaceae bacterium]|nr:hypothetical protein [Syntrophorhabdaceae bacterium]HOL05726.1 hypothetical protein [Syntrophorhabdaceae bacterium]HON85846.1 hypothetical protein [Syntrophorhabdaceae bacterium]HOT42768.1 hypothetical protein [Syntrophorhabdaceae bacterium]HPC67220.1 hypothetical protein [Syntrophorhabdaceae bacterium]
MRGDYLLYLKVGDQVYHRHYTRWGLGVVVEERRSELPGGFCYVRVCFQDGKTRVFDNNFKSDGCCYYAGVEKIEVAYEIKEEKQKDTKVIGAGQRTRKLKG